MIPTADEHPDALLPGYTVANLTPDELGQVEAHLAGCAQCRASLRSLQTTALLLHNLPPVELPRSFLLPPSTAPRQGALRLLLPLSFLSAAAVLFLALGLSLALSRPAATVAFSQGAVAGARSVTASAQGFGAATTVAATSAAAAAARAAAAQRPAAVANSGQQSVTAQAAAPSVLAAPTSPKASLAATSTPAPPAASPVRSAPGVKAYQVLLGGGGIVCLVVAVGGIVRNWRGPPRRTGPVP